MSTQIKHIPSAVCAVSLAISVATGVPQGYAQSAAGLRIDAKAPAFAVQARIGRDAVPEPNPPQSLQQGTIPQPNKYEWHLDFEGGYGFKDSTGKSMAMRNNLDVDARQAWDITTGRPSIVVAVIDTGIDIYHPLLKKNIYVNSAEIPGNRKDDDKNGYIDDVSGWNVVDNNGLIEDYFSMGTYLAGTIVASGKAGDATGIAPSVQVMGIKAVTTSGDKTTYYFDRIAAALDYVIKARSTGVDVRVVTLGYMEVDHRSSDPYIKLIVQKLKTLSDAGVSIVVPVPTGGRDLDKLATNPSRIDASGVLSAMGVGFTGEPSFNTDYGATTVTIAAPNFQVLGPQSSLGRNVWPYYTIEEKGVKFPVSFIVSNAAPQGLLAGTAALMYSVNPDLRPEKVAEIIMKTAKQPGGPQLPKLSSSEQAPPVRAKGFLDTGDAVQAARELVVNGVVRAGPKVVSGATVVMRGVLGGKSFDMTVKTNSEGFFSIQRPPVGIPITISVSHPRYHFGAPVAALNNQISRPPAFVIDATGNRVE